MLRSGAGFMYSDQQVGFAALQEWGEEGNPGLSSPGHGDSQKLLHIPWAKGCDGNRGGMEMRWEEQ